MTAADRPEPSPELREWARALAATAPPLDDARREQLRAALRRRPPTERRRAS